MYVLFRLHCVRLRVTWKNLKVHGPRRNKTILLGFKQSETLEGLMEDKPLHVLILYVLNVVTLKIKAKGLLRPVSSATETS